MPKLKYNPKKDIEKAAYELHSLQPTVIRKWILNRYNKSVTPESITNWLRRHPDVKQRIENTIHSKELPQEEIIDSIFINGTFEKIPSIAEFIKDMRRRSCTTAYIRQMVGSLKQICKGVFPRQGIDLVAFHGWNYKHPDRLSLDDCIEFIDIMLEHYPDVETSNIRRAMRNFLMSKGIAVGKKISGSKSKGAGKLANMFVEREVLDKVLAYVKSLNFEAYVVDLYMFNTGTRIKATLNALIENIRVEGEYIEQTIYDKGRRSKYPDGHRWDKFIPKVLWVNLKTLIGKRRSGKMFNITKQEMSNLNRTALTNYCPEIFVQYPHVAPNHFWRHMFAQHMLRATKWNYGAVAALGGWTVTALEESYGKPPRATIKEWGMKFVPTI